METSAVGVLGQTQPRTSNRSLDSLQSEDFFKILVTELQQQDPLDPSETSDMISQVSDIRNIEQSDQLNRALDALAGQQRTANAGTMIGKYVSALTQLQDGTTNVTEGVVTGVRFDDQGTAILELDTGQAIKATDVDHISDLNAQGVAAPVDLNGLTDSIIAAINGNAANPAQETPAQPDEDDKSGNARLLRDPLHWLQR